MRVPTGRPAIDAGEVRGALGRLYDDFDAEVAARRPVCALSGRCCRFEEYGHTLFVTAIEFALLAADAPDAEPGRWTTARHARGRTAGAIAPPGGPGRWGAGRTIATRHMGPTRRP